MIQELVVASVVAGRFAFRAIRAPVCRDPVWVVTDPGDGRQPYANPRSTAQSGAGQAAAIGRYPMDALPGASATSIASRSGQRLALNHGVLR